NLDHRRRTGVGDVGKSPTGAGGAEAGDVTSQHDGLLVGATVEECRERLDVEILTVIGGRDIRPAGRDRLVARGAGRPDDDPQSAVSRALAHRARDRLLGVDERAQSDERRGRRADHAAAGVADLAQGDLEPKPAPSQERPRDAHRHHGVAVRCGGLKQPHQDSPGAHSWPAPRSGYPSGGAETSSRASRISAGSSTSTSAKIPSNWAAVRAPTTGAATPGRSRTQASATASGETPRPSAAVQTACTTRPCASSRYGSTNDARWSLAARESAGIPVRYLPVSTPRPSGDQGNTDIPASSAAGTTSRSTPRSNSEYSTWVHANGARPGQAACHDAALAVCHPVKFEIPT